MKKNKIISCTAASIVIAVLLTPPAVILANSPRPTWGSSGVADFTGDPEHPVVFDSSDLDTIYNETTEGRSAITEKIIEKNPAWASLFSGNGSDSYSSIAAAIERQITLPADESGQPVLPTLSTSYSFVSGPDDAQIRYTYNDVPVSPIQSNGFVYEGGEKVKVNGATLTYSDDLPVDRFAYTPDGNLAIGSGKSEAAAVKAEFEKLSESSANFDSETASRILESTQVTIAGETITIGTMEDYSSDVQTITTTSATGTVSVDIPDGYHTFVKVDQTNAYNAGADAIKENAQAAKTWTPTILDQTIAQGKYLSGTQTIKGDANLIAGNIKKGTSIFGVTGTYTGGGTYAIKSGSASSSNGKFVISVPGTPQGQAWGYAKYNTSNPFSGAFASGYSSQLQHGNGVDGMGTKCTASVSGSNITLTFNNFSGCNCSISYNVLYIPN